MRLDHAGVHVANLQRSIAFYSGVLGLPVQAQLTLGPEQIVFLGSRDGMVELIQDERPARLNAGPVDHLALQVERLDEVLDTLRRERVPLLDEQPIVVPEIDARIAFCLGPDGERVELIERARNRPCA